MPALPWRAPPPPDLGFESRLAALSRHFLSLGSEGVDSAIHEAVAWTADLAGADRAWLIHIDVEPPWLAERYEWHAPGVPAFAAAVRDDDRRRFRWSSEMLARGETLHVRDPVDLPAEAAPEREDMLHRGVLCLLGIPVLSDGNLIGYFSVERLSRPGGWEPREVERLRLLAEILATALRRLRSEEALARQRAGERRLAALSRRLLALGPAERETEAALHAALRELADLAGADRTFLLGFGEPGSADFEFHEWCGEGVSGAEPRARPWATRELLAGHVLHVPDPAELPPEAAAEREDLESRGVRSLLGLPAFSGTALLGFLGFEAMRAPRHWRDQEITLLRVAAELMAGALRRRRAERALRESQAQLLHAQKMDALGRLAGGVAHDFNNLLTVIAGHAEMLLRSLEAGRGERADAEEIQRATDRAAALTRRLLAFGRRDPASREPVDLNGVARTMRNLLERVLGHSVGLLFEPAEGPLVVRADAQQLEQVLLNLALNGRDAMPTGGRLEVRLSACTPGRGEAERLGLVGERPHAVLSVADTGQGMDEPTRTRIFEPFFTTKEPGAGTGLGLSIVYGIVRQHGGSIDVSSQPGSGSRFDVWLPLSTTSPAAVRPAPPAPAAAASGPAHLLLAEDEPAVRRLLRRVLEDAGYRVTVAVDGVDALERFAELGTALDGVVTDVAMPRMGGPELVERLRVAGCGLPVLFLSGCPSPDDGEERPPEQEILAKPFSSDQLLARVRSMLAGS